MSLDMTIATRGAQTLGGATQEDETEVDAQAAVASRLWLRDAMVAAAIGLGVLMSAALSVLLFLR